MLHRYWPNDTKMIDHQFWSNLLYSCPCHLELHLHVISYSSRWNVFVCLQTVGAYCVSKAALLNLCKVMASACGPKNIRVNAIAPGLIRTKFSEFVSIVYYYIVYWPFCGTTWSSLHLKGKPFWILMKQEMMRWQWHQLDHMQIICTSLQTPHHSAFYGPDAFPSNSVKALKQYPIYCCNYL